MIIEVSAGLRYETLVVALRIGCEDESTHFQRVTIIITKGFRIY